MPSHASGPGAGPDAGDAWTSYDDVKGWQKPSGTKRFAAVWNAPVYIHPSLVTALTASLVLTVFLLLTLTRISMLLILMLIIIFILVSSVFLQFFFQHRQMAEAFESLNKRVDLSPKDAIARIESVLLSARMPFTRLSREDPDRFWEDMYSETFVVHGGRAKVRVYDERPSGTGKATKVYVGPASPKTEQLVSTLAWHLDKALSESEPHQ